MASLRIIPTLLSFLFLFGVHVNANPVANDASENESSWLKQWMNCFFNDASEDVGHFFLTRLINCWPTTPTKQFLIVGGYSTYSGGNHLATEVIDVQPNSNVTSSFEDIPSQRRHAVGGLLGSTPILCGGDDENDRDQYSCFTYSHGYWIKTHFMTTKRYVAASVQINATTLWILGGYQGEFTTIGGYSDKRLDSSEFVGIDSTVGKPGPKLPYDVSHHCAVKYKNKVYMIGGKVSSSSYLNKVLIFNPMNDFTHIEGPSLITKRGRHACSLMSNGQQSKIVVAGGYGNGFNPLSSVEIFDPTVNNWISGPPLPYRLADSAMATSPDGGGVVLFGGYNADRWDDDNGAIEDTILELRYDSDKWTTLPQKLKQPRREHVVIPIN